MLIPEPCIQNAVLLLIKSWLMPNYLKQKTVKRENLFLDFTFVEQCYQKSCILSGLALCNAMVLPWWLGSRCDQVQAMFVFSSSVHIQGLQSWITSDLPGPYPHCPQVRDLHGTVFCSISMGIGAASCGSVSFGCRVHFPCGEISYEHCFTWTLRAGNPCGYCVVGWATTMWGGFMGREEPRVSQIKMFCLWACQAFELSECCCALSRADAAEWGQASLSHEEGELEFVLVIEQIQVVWPHPATLRRPCWIIHAVFSGNAELVGEIHKQQREHAGEGGICLSLCLAGVA